MRVYVFIHTTDIRVLCFDTHTKEKCALDRDGKNTSTSGIEEKILICPFATGFTMLHECSADFENFYPVRGTGVEVEERDAWTVGGRD